MTGHELNSRKKNKAGAGPGAWLRLLLALPCAGTSLALADEAGVSPEPPAGLVAPRPTATWTIAVDAIVLKRSSGSTSQTLTSTVPAGMHYLQTANPSNATAAFNSRQFDQSAEAGPKIALSYRDQSGYGLELSYFKVLDLTDTQTTGPTGSWLTMYAPGVFWQTQDYPNQGFAWTATSSLRSAEANARREVAKGLSLLAGFRWLRLNDALSGAVSPADQYLPNWKTSVACHPDPTFQDLQNCPSERIATSIASDFSTFWTTSTTNKLFGLQIGAEGDVLTIGNLALGGSLKAGAYNNRATQNGGVSMAKEFYYAAAASSRAAYVGEAALRLRYRLSDALALRMGYGFLWLDRVALASGQIAQTYAASPKSLSATGVNSGSSVWFQGTTLGLEYSF